MPRRLALLALFGVLAAIWAPVLASANPDVERQFTDLVAHERAAAGVPAYAEMAELVDVARRHAQRMAADGRLYHNPNLGTEVKDWQAVGENVGRGPSVESIHRAFMDSATHRREILSTTFTQIGVGVAVAADGEIWVAQVFRKPAAPPPPPPPPPPAEPAPVAQAPAPPPPAPAAAPPAAASARQNPDSVRPSRARTPEPAPAPAPPAAPAAQPDLTTLERAFDNPGVARELPTALVAAVDVEPDVTMEVRVAATFLVLVVGGLAYRVTAMSGGAVVLLPAWVTRSRRRLAASAATLP